MKVEVQNTARNKLKKCVYALVFTVQHLKRACNLGEASLREEFIEQASRTGQPQEPKGIRFNFLAWPGVQYRWKFDQ
jgi:hypothetical protein